jgi:SAM-dependent methyltransferase
MSLYQAAKGIVPLEWKVAFHKYKCLPRNLTVRTKTRLAGQPPVPPNELIYLVAGHHSPKAFLDGGRSARQAISEMLEKNGLRFEQFESVLDFGCGVGRIIRHWSHRPAQKLYGIDYNLNLVKWCQHNLKFANFNVNELSGKLPYDSETFDFIYSFSVFTHLKEPLQLHWIIELSRVLKPGGYIYITTHGEYYLSDLTAPEQEQFHNGQLVVRAGERSGSNVCVAFHPRSYVQKTLACDLIPVDFVQSGAKGDSLHDAHLLKKRKNE